MCLEEGVAGRVVGVGWKTQYMLEGALGTWRLGWTWSLGWNVRG